MSITNEEILNIAMEQSAIDLNCNKEDFLKESNVIVNSDVNRKARNYLKLPFDCNLVSYGNNIVASVSSQLKELTEKYILNRQFYRCFETPALHIFNDELDKMDFRVCFMAEYFLPDVYALRELPCNYKLKVLEKEDFSDLYKPQWSNALCEDRKQYDVLAAGAYDREQLVGLAGCSADCETMWQIGVDVLPQYRRKGIASALTSKLALEILKRGKIPFYCCAWSNIKSARNAFKSGFRPAWAELTAKSKEFVESMNKQ